MSLKIPLYIHAGATQSIEFENYLRTLVPGVQIRFCGLQWNAFPHEKRIPYINVAVDGSGSVLSATLVCNSVL